MTESTARSLAAQKGWQTRRENAALLVPPGFIVRQHHLDEAETYWARLAPEVRRKHLDDGFFDHLPQDMLERFRTEALDA